MRISENLISFLLRRPLASGGVFAIVSRHLSIHDCVIYYDNFHVVLTKRRGGQSAALFFNGVTSSLKGAADGDEESAGLSLEKKLALLGRQPQKSCVDLAHVYNSRVR